MRRLLLLALLAPACVDDPDPLLADHPERTCTREWQGTSYVSRFEDGWSAPLACVGREIDLDPTTAGLQTDCVASLYRDIGLDERRLDHVQQLLPCDRAAPGEPCLAPFAEHDGCQDGLRFEVDLGDHVSAFPLWAELRCRLACEPS